MPNISKSSKKAAPKAAAAKPDFVDAVTPLYRNGVERVAEWQKKSLDIAAEQTSGWIDAWKKAFSYLPVAPPAFVFDVASQALQTAVETQKGAVDLVVEQVKSVSDITQARAQAYSEIFEGLTGTFQKSIERSLEAQKEVLEFAAERNKAVFESTKKQLGASAGPATAIVDTFQRGADAVIEAQKSVLNIAAQPFMAAAKN